MRKKALLILLVFPLICVAQLDALSKFHLFNQGSINPAFSSSSENASIALYHRSELMGFEGNPVTSTLSYNSFIGSSNFGYGLNFKSDKIGATSFYDYSFDLSYALKLSDDIFMGLGLRSSFNNLNIDYQLLNLYNSGDVFFENNVDREILANVGFGLSIFNKFFNISLSMPYIIKQYHYDSYARNNNGFEASSIDLTYLTANATIPLSSKLSLRPYVLIKSSTYFNSQTDVSLIAETKNFNFGFSHRFDFSSAFYLGLFLSDNLLLSYSYDLPSNNFDYYRNGAHEFGVKFNFISKVNNVFISKKKDEQDVKGSL